MGSGTAGDSDGFAAPTMRLVALPSEPSAADVRLFPEEAPEPGPPAVGDEPPRRRRRTALLGAAGAVVTVVAAAGLASGLFSYDTPTRDGALPDDVRASVPESSPEEASMSPPGSTSSAAPVPVAPAPSRSASPSPSASVSATPSRSATPTPTPTTPSATGSAEPSRDGSDEPRVQVLRRGDEGSEVTELQLRLHQLSLYIGDTDGDFTHQVEDAVRRYQWARGVTDDEQGVYGAATRASLEAETAEP